MGEGAGVNRPPYFEKLRVPKLIYTPFFRIKFKKKIVFYFNMETYCPVIS
jgi:hypothetical protein